MSEASQYRGRRVNLTKPFYGQSPTPRDIEVLQKERSSLTPVLLIALLLGIVGCRDTSLTRSRAAQLIVQSEAFQNYRNIVQIQVGSKCIQDSKVKAVSHRLEKALESLGYLRIEVVERLLPEDPTFVLVRTTLTAKAKAASPKWERRPLVSRYCELFAIPVSQAELVEVTGVRVFEQLKEARVEFRWKKSSPTSIGTQLVEAGFKDIILGGIEKGEAVFSLYDDGWRVATLNFRQAEKAKRP